MSLSQTEKSALARQINRERGIEFGRYEETSDDPNTAIAALYRQIFQESLGLLGDDDESLSLFDARADFGRRLAQRAARTAPGQPSDSEQVLKALGLNERALRKNQSPEDQKRWLSICESLFSLTLHELLRLIIVPLTAEEADENEFAGGKDGQNFDESDYAWTPAIKVYQSVWEACLLEITLQTGDAWAKAKALRRADNARQHHALRNKMLREALAATGIELKLGLAFAGDLIALLMTVLPTPLFQWGTRKKAVVIFNGRNAREAGVDAWCLMPTEALLERIQVRIGKTRLIYRYAPLLIPPRAWDAQDGGLFSGAYFVSPLEFYKFPAKNARIDRFLNTCNRLDNSEVFAAVNALQRTPWRINNRVWDTVQNLLRIGLQPGNGDTDAACRQRQERIKNSLFDADLLKPYPELSREQRRQRYSQPGMRLLAPTRPGIASGSITLNTLTDLCVQERFYFAYQADSRGRLYAKTGWLGPYGEDLAKSLLVFADAKPLTATGVLPLALHGSQQIERERILKDLGITGRHTPTLDERRRWIDLHAERIRSVASEPCIDLWWADPTLTHKPFAFLAFCFAWADYLEQGENAPCALPVHVDGTCNGLQHIAAMTGDAALARATNVLPGEPQDIYLETAVAAIVILQDGARLTKILAGVEVKLRRKDHSDLQRALPNLDKLAEQTLHVAGFIGAQKYLIDRSLAKKIVMVIPYGAGWKTYGEKVYEDLCEVIKKQKDFNDALETVSVIIGCEARELLRMTALVIAATFTEVLAEAFPVIQSFKTWLNRAVQPLIARNIPVIWVSPSGFCALQRGFQLDRVEVVSALFGNRKLRLTYPRLKDDVAAKEQNMAILANYIHSFDAAHLVKTINLARRENIAHFSVVHDSYATHPADMPVLARCLRQAFVDIYAAKPGAMARFQAWCAAVVYVYDHAGIEQDIDYGGYDPTAAEQALLLLVRDWSLSRLTQGSAETSANRLTSKQDKQHPLPPRGFDVRQVAESLYFFC